MSKESIHVNLWQNYIFTVNCNVNKVQPTYMYVDERKCFEKKILEEDISCCHLLFKEEFKNSGDT